MEAISATNLVKMADYFDRGSKVIATTRLPDQSAEPGKSEEVRRLIRHIFGAQAAESQSTRPRGPKTSASSVWQGGGCDVALAFDGDYKIGEISCPAHYFDGMQTMPADVGMSYGVGCLKAALDSAVHRAGFFTPPLFDPAAQTLLEGWTEGVEA